MPALVAIIGRPNVGKSTLFNRIAGERLAIESPVAGTTRDPISFVYRTPEADMLFVDTGGLEFGSSQHGIEEDVQYQAKIALEDAHVIVFCVSMKEEITAADQKVVEILRKRAGNTPVLLVGTKDEGKNNPTTCDDLWSLAIGQESPITICALHNRGISELLNTVENMVLKRGFQKEETQENMVSRIAVLGRPNVGKSSLINAFLKKEKLIVSDVAGTTRDSIDSQVRQDGKQFLLIDTAGIRRKSKIDEKIEKYSIMRSLASLHRADVAFLLLDADEGVTHQDKHIAGSIIEAKTGLVVVVNKWDLAEKEGHIKERFLNYLHRELPFLPWAPVVFASAKERKNLHQLLPLAEKITEERQKRIPTKTLNNFLIQAEQLHATAGVRNTRPKIKYGTQVGVSPPHFVFSGARLDAIHFSSRRYLENRLRDSFGFHGTPITIEMRTKENPYHTRRKIRLPAEARGSKT